MGRWNEMKEPESLEDYAARLAQQDEWQPASVGGSIGRALPCWGTGLMLLDFFRLTRPQDLQPQDDSSRIY